MTEQKFAESPFLDEADTGSSCKETFKTNTRKTLESAVECKGGALFDDRGDAHRRLFPGKREGDDQVVRHRGGQDDHGSNMSLSRKPGSVPTARESTDARPGPMGAGAVPSPGRGPFSSLASAPTSFAKLSRKGAPLTARKRSWDGAVGRERGPPCTE